MFATDLSRPALDLESVRRFVVVSDKWDFYEMDSYRILGDDTRASRHAREVLKLDVRADGTEKSPVRVAEALLTLGAAAAHSGELEEAVSFGSKTLVLERNSLPSLLSVSGELDGELQSRCPREILTGEFRDQFAILIEESNRALEV